MTRTRPRPRRRAARREDEARRGKRAAPVTPHDSDVERSLAEEVLYLHSLWRSGPPAPAFHPGGGSLATHERADRRKRRRLERLAEPEDTGPDWPLAPSPPASPPPGSWPKATTSSPTQLHPPPQPSPASLAQRPALRAAEEFFSGHASESGDDDDEEEGSESEDAGETATGFFMGLFERDAALRGYYERSYEEGEFLCLGCAGRRARKGRARRFRDCISLVQHARAATRCGRRRAHRALASTVCRVLGWDIDRLPSIVIDPRGTLGQALLAREAQSAAAAATAHEAKEDVDGRMKDGAPLSDGAAAKEDVGTMKRGPSSDYNGGEVHEQQNVIESAEKEETHVIDPLRSKDTPNELCEDVQEDKGAINDKQEHAKSADDAGDTCTVMQENNSPKGESTSKNKEEHTNNIVGTGDDDIGNPGNSLMDSSKS